MDYVEERSGRCCDRASILGAMGRCCLWGSVAFGAGDVGRGQREVCCQPVAAKFARNPGLDRSLNHCWGLRGTGISRISAASAPCAEREHRSGCPGAGRGVWPVPQLSGLDECDRDQRPRGSVWRACRQAREFARKHHCPCLVRHLGRLAANAGLQVRTAGQHFLFTDGVQRARCFCRGGCWLFPVFQPPHYNRGMPFLADPRRRSVALLAGGVVLGLALLGGLNAFNTTNLQFLNPETSGETLLFTSLTVVVFLLLLVLLMLLLRNMLKLYADQSSIALGSRLRTRMVLGAALIALTPAVFMFLFSFNLMNRSIDRWFSQPTWELREDSTRVVLELAHYVTGNARVEAESIAASGAADRDPQSLQEELASHRITLGGGFAVGYGKDSPELTS